MPSAVLDAGHEGMTLTDFVESPTARAAELSAAQVLALRLYSSSVYRTINCALRDGCSAARPHPFPALVAHLAEAIKQLRSVGATPPCLWRGVRDFEAGDEFLQRGGTEMAPLSTTADRRVAEEYALRLNAWRATVLFRLKVPTLLQCGADISFCSCFPGEREYLFPPGVHLKPTGEQADERLEGGGAIKVVEVEPVYAY